MLDCVGLVVAVLGFGFLISKPSLAKDTVTFAFAKASPLEVYSSPELVDERRLKFVFAKAYEVVEKSSNWVSLRLEDSSVVYVKSSHLALVQSPEYVVSAPGYKLTERNKISFWRSAGDLGEFLSGSENGLHSWDYREFFETAPNFNLKLPVFATDTMELGNGSRQVGIAGVFVPVSRGMFEEFTRVINKKTQYSIHLVLDVSGSTVGFLEPLLNYCLDKILLSGFDDVIKGIDVTIFSQSEGQYLKEVGKKGVAGLIASNFRVIPGTGRTGDAELLGLGLQALLGEMAAREFSAGGEKHLILVLSGADVGMQLGDAPSHSLDFSDVGNGVIVFAEVTPEPGNSLREVSKSIRGISSEFLGYSSDLDKRLLGVIAAHLNKEGLTGRKPSEFFPMARVSHSQNMLAFLPRELDTSPSLPKAQSFAEGADWYVVPLWVVLDPAILLLNGE
jgi:hypothetical protein